MVEAARAAFVCGHPIAHSLSPTIHGYWLQRLGIKGTYGTIDVAPEAFEEFLRNLGSHGFIGGNVTIPHKEAAFRGVARRDAAAEAIGAVNTLWFANGELWGGNTDSYGFAANLDEQAPEWRGGTVAVVLGARGAARAVTHALIQNGYEDVRIVNRTLERADALADRFGSATTAHPLATPALLAEAGLLVNTTSLGMRGAGGLAADPAGLRRGAIVADIVYAPLETPLLAAARAQGLKTVDGLGMLLHQAVPGFERWFGEKPEVTPELRRILLDVLEARA